MAKAKPHPEIGYADPNYNPGSTLDSPPEPEPAKKGRRPGPIMDDEMKVMNAINRAISKLPSEAAKIRVLRYMSAKLEFPIVDQAQE